MQGRRDGMMHRLHRLLIQGRREDLDGAQRPALLQAAGHHPFGGRGVYFADPNGHLFEVMTKVEPPAGPVGEAPPR